MAEEIEDVGILSVEQCLEDYGYFTLEKENSEYACVVVMARTGGSVLAVPEAVYAKNRTWRTRTWITQEWRGLEHWYQCQLGMGPRKVGREEQF